MKTTGVPPVSQWLRHFTEQPGRAKKTLQARINLEARMEIVVDYTKKSILSQVRTGKTGSRLLERG